MLAIAPAMLTKKTLGNYPAPEAILSAMVEGSLVDFETASRIESRYFVELLTGKVAKNMINAFWFQLNEISSGASRPDDIPKTKVQKLGVLGSGLMGHGISYVAALSGIEVVCIKHIDNTYHQFSRKIYPTRKIYWDSLFLSCTQNETSRNN